MRSPARYMCWWWRGEDKDCVLEGAFPDPISFDSASRHAAPVHNARFPSVSGLKQDSCAVLGSSPSLRSIRAAHDGLALGKETVSDRQRKALTGPSVRLPIDRRTKSEHTKHRFPLPLAPAKEEAPAAHGEAPGQTHAVTRRVPKARQVSITANGAAAGIRSRVCRLTSAPERGRCITLSCAPVKTGVRGCRRLEQKRVLGA